MPSIAEPEGVTRAVKVGEGSGNIPKVIVYDDYNQNIPKNQSVIGTITTNIGSSTPRNGIKLIEVFEPICVAMRGREPQVLTPKRTELGKAMRKKYESHEIEISRHDMTTMEPRTDGVSNTLTSVQKDNYLAIPEATSKGYAEAYEGDSVNFAVPNSKTRRGRVGKQMANTLDTGCQQGVVEQENNVRYRIRKLTPRECFRLMGVDDADIDKIQGAGISNSQQYKMAGNSIVVDTLYHLFRKMFVDTGCDDNIFQQSLF
jgi:site-specific DNA-cytosine methylase